MIQTFKKLT